MSQPNKTVANVREKKTWILGFEEVKNTFSEAETLKNSIKEDYDKMTIEPFRTGPRNQRLYSYAVRGYFKNIAI